MVARFDDGAVSWSLVGPPDERPTQAALDPNGDVLLSLRPDEQLQDARVVRVSEGELTDEVALPSNTWLTSIAVDAAGTSYVAGLPRLGLGSRLRQRGRPGLQRGDVWRRHGQRDGRRDL